MRRPPRRDGPARRRRRGGAPPAHGLLAAPADPDGDASSTAAPTCSRSPAASPATCRLTRSSRVRGSTPALTATGAVRLELRRRSGEPRGPVHDQLDTTTSPGRQLRRAVRELLELDRGEPRIPYKTPRRRREPRLLRSSSTPRRARGWSPASSSPASPTAADADAGPPPPDGQSCSFRSPPRRRSRTPSWTAAPAVIAGRTDDRRRRRSSGSLTLPGLAARRRHQFLPVAGPRSWALASSLATSSPMPISWGCLTAATRATSPTSRRGPRPRRPRRRASRPGTTFTFVFVGDNNYTLTPATTSGGTVPYDGRFIHIVAFPNNFTPTVKLAQ